MAFCSKCGTEFNDGTQFCPKCGQATNVASQQQEEQPTKPDSNMILAVLSTLFCCLPIGVYAIILANKVDKLYYAEEYDEAEEASNGAKKWAIIGAVIAVIGYFFYFIVVGLTAATV